MPKKILFASDFSALAGATCDYVRALALASEASVILLHVEQPLLPDLMEAYAVAYPDSYGALNRERKARVQAGLEELRGRLSGLTVEPVVRRGIASMQIVALARRRHVDLIVLGHRYAPLRSALLGSTSTYVLQHSPCPVLIVPLSESKAESKAEPKAESKAEPAA